MKALILFIATSLIILWAVSYPPVKSRANEFHQIQSNEITLQTTKRLNDFKVDELKQNLHVIDSMNNN